MGFNRATDFIIIGLWLNTSKSIYKQYIIKGRVADLVRSRVFRLPLTSYLVIDLTHSEMNSLVYMRSEDGYIERFRLEKCSTSLKHSRSLHYHIYHFQTLLLEFLPTGMGY